MIVVSDTSPLNYLVLIEAIAVLPALFAHVYVPEQVAAELRDLSAHQSVRAWIASPPPWLLIRTPKRIDPGLKLDPGEVHAIALAEELHADHLLVDERDARAVAARRGLHVIGTLGVLDKASRGNLIDLKKACERLLQTSFRVDRQLIQGLLEQNAKP
jgi:predicted nucleic acid-binding protein